jgi:hypothetical protein
MLWYDLIILVFDVDFVMYKIFGFGSVIVWDSGVDIISGLRRFHFRLTSEALRLS